MPNQLTFAIKRMTKYDGGATKAFFTVTINGIIEVHNCKLVMNKNNELFVGFPQSLNKKANKWYTVCWIADVTSRENLKDVAIEAYNKLVPATV